jgi:SAM-dependent methyltransferase
MPEPAQIYTPEYYQRLKAIEGNHWWTLGMNDIMSTLVAGRTHGREIGCFLDIGCGSGIGLAWAARKWPEARRIGLDVSSYALEHCRELGAELHQVEGEALPLPDASVDLAICIDVLQHVKEESAVVGEAARVLRPGGFFFVRTNAQAFGVAAPAGGKLFTRRLLSACLREAGLEVLHCSPVNVVGALVGTARGLLGKRGHGQGHSHGHGAGHDDEPAVGQDAAATKPFHGGGYDRGLRLQPEDPGRPGSRLKRALLRLEGRWIRSCGRLPVGHSLVALARRPST